MATAEDGSKARAEDGSKARAEMFKDCTCFAYMLTITLVHY